MSATKKRKKGGFEVLSFPPEGWFEKEGQSRAKGRTIRYRYVIVARKWGWSVGEWLEGGISLSPNTKYPGCVRHMYFSLRAVGYDQISMSQYLRLMNDRLAELTGTRLEIDIPDPCPGDTYDQLAKQIDNFYKVDYGRYDGIKTRLSGTDMEEDEDE